MVVTPYHRGTADPRASGYAEEVAADVFESTVRQAQRGQEIGIHGLLEAQARRMVPGGAKTAGNRAEGAEQRRRATGAECGRGRSARGWCQHFGFLVCNQLVNVFRPDYACENAGSTGGRAAIRDHDWDTSNCRQRTVPGSVG